MTNPKVTVMTGEPKVITNGPLQPFTELRAQTGFAWSCRQGVTENGELTEIHQITSADRSEYARHMRGHGLAAPKSGYEPWKPWKPPRPVKEHKPRPMDAGQRAEWVKVTGAHWENPGHQADDGTYVRPSGARVEETRETRAGVIWSVADSPTAWWVQPDDDPAHPVYVKRAGKSHRDRAYGEGTLYEVPGAAEAARASVLRGEIVRKRGIFPVVDAVLNEYGNYDTGTHRRADGSRRVSVAWHSDEACPRAQGKEPYDPASPGIAYGYRSHRDVAWTPLDVAEILAGPAQAPSCLCADCIIGLDADGPDSPARREVPQPGIPANAVSEPQESTHLHAPATAARQAPRTCLTAAAPEPNGVWKQVIGSTHGFEPESDSHLLGWMAGEAGGMSGYAEEIADVYETAVNTIGLDPVAMAALHDYADAAATAAEAMAKARQRFADHYSEVRQFTANGGVLPYNGRWMTGEGD